MLSNYEALFLPSLQYYFYIFQLSSSYFCISVVGLKTNEDKKKPDSKGPVVYFIGSSNFGPKSLGTPEQFLKKRITLLRRCSLRLQF